MPVQPMKSIAAEALADKEFGVPEIMAAGILTGGILFILGITGLMKRVYKWIPLPVVRGIQLAQGLSFTLTAVKYVREVQDLPKSKTLGERPWFGLDGLVLAIFCACFILIINGAGEQNRGCIDTPENGDNLDGERSDKGGRNNRINKLRKFVFSLPSTFLVFILGIILVFIRKNEVVQGIKFGPSSIQVVKFTKQSWK
jgi:MFS superfamily sulfate permease-like transporter